MTEWLDISSAPRDGSCIIVRREMKVRMGDRLTIEAVCLQPPGGQHVGGAFRGIRVTDTQTGNVAECHTHRSQHKNRQTAIEMLTWADPSLEQQELTNE